jgi:hypothetical protein
MSQPSHHSELAELLPAAALEILEGDELGRVEAHARECSECSKLLRQYREAAASLGVDLPAQPLERGRSQLLRARLLDRAASRTVTAPFQPPVARPTSRRTPPWIGWAVAAGLAGVLLVHHGFHRPLAYGWVVAGLLAIALVVVVGYALTQRARAITLERSADTHKPPDS